MQLDQLVPDEGHYLTKAFTNKSEKGEYFKIIADW